MSIIQLKSNEIDPKAWDKLVEKCSDSKIFSKYDYLKAVSPDFEAIVQKEGNDYKSAFPLTIKSKYGLDYIVQPVFTQQIQILSESGPASEDFMEALDKKLKNFISIRFSLDEKSAYRILKTSSYKSLKRISYVLDLSEDEFEKGYSKNHKRNIKSANKTNWQLDINNDYESLINEFKRYKGKEIKLSRNFMDSFKKLVPFFKSEEKIQIFSALDENGSRIASALFAGHKDVMTFLLSYSGGKAKKNGIMHAIINEWLLKHSKGYKLLDFEGGNIPSLARFYSAFGAKKQEFRYLEKHRFPLGYLFK